MEPHQYEHFVRQIGHIDHKLEKIMATLKDVQDAVAKLAADATAEKDETSAAIKVLTDQIQALKDQLAAGTVVSAADLDALVTSLNAVDAQVQAITVPATPVV